MKPHLTQIGWSLWRKMPTPRTALPRTDPLEPKDRNARGQGHMPALVFSKKKVFKNFFQAISIKGLQNFFWGEKNLQKIFFWRSPIKENKKRSSQIFRKVYGVFQQNFHGSKNSADLEPRTGQFSRIWGQAKDLTFKAEAKDFKMCPRGQGRPRGLHLWLEPLSIFFKFIPTSWSPAYHHLWHLHETSAQDCPNSWWDQLVSSKWHRLSIRRVGIGWESFCYGVICFLTWMSQTLKVRIWCLYLH